MTRAPRRTRTLRARIVRAFVAYAVVVMVVVGAGTTIFVYTMEDRFFNGLVAEEAAAQRATRTATGRWRTPAHPWMTVHDALATLPADLAPQLRAEPERREFRGDEGRHYHVQRLAGGGDARGDAWLVAEVSDRLVLRPARTGMVTAWLVFEGAALAFAVVAAGLLARRIARPLSTLAASVRALEPGAAPTPLPVDVGDREVAAVATAIDELRSRVAGFVAREQAFTRDVGHELRTPLAIVRSTSARLLADPALPEPTRRAVTRIAAATDRLEWTVRSLLELAREPAAPAAPIALRPIVEGVILDFDEPLRARGLVVGLALPADAALAADPTVLRLVLANLVGNACTHAAPGPFAIASEGGALVLRNRVDPAALPPTERLGTPGVRRDDSPGFGLGLGIGRRLCERHGLSLAVETSDDAFTVRIGAPAAAPSPSS